MLQEKSVREPLWNLLKELQNSEVFDNYFLVGGTALSLQLGHRISDDIDLFTRHDIDKYELIEDIQTEDGIKYWGKKDLAAMKLMAVANRGDQAKDFIDIYYLLKEMPLKDMFEYYKAKYRQNDINPVKRSLIYFDDVTESNWLSVRLLYDTLSVKKIKQKINDEVNNYNKNIGLVQ